MLAATAVCVLPVVCEILLYHKVVQASPATCDDALSCCKHTSSTKHLRRTHGTESQVVVTVRVLQQYEYHHIYPLMAYTIYMYICYYLLPIHPFAVASSGVQSNNHTCVRHMFTGHVC